MKKKSLRVLSMLLAIVMMLMLVACGETAKPDEQTSTSSNEPADTADKKEADVSSETAGTIKIGVIGPLTGPSAEGGIATQQGMQLAEMEINEAGGIKVGDQMMKLELLFEDAQSKPEIGVSLAEKLITSDKVDILVGDAINSSVTLAIMELSSKYDILFSTVQCVSQEIPKKVQADPEAYARFWKPEFNSDAYGKDIASFILAGADSGVIPFENKTVAYLVEDTDYGRSNAEYAEKFLSEAGVETVALEVFPNGHTDFYPQLNKLKSLKPDVVVSCFTAVASGVALCKQIQETSCEFTHLGIVYPIKDGFFEQAGSSCEKLFYTPLLADFENNDNDIAFGAKMQDKIGVTPTADQMHAYDVVYLLKGAIEKAGTLEGDALAKAYSESDYQGVLARYVFDTELHSIYTGPDYYSLNIAQVQDGSPYVVYPESVATKDAIPQH